MTATGLPSHDGSSWLAGFGSFMGELHDLQLPGLASPSFQIPCRKSRLAYRWLIRYHNYWWWRSYPYEIQGLCGRILQRHGRHSCTAQPVDHMINLEPGFNLPYGQIYYLSEVKLKTLQAYIKTNTAKRFIQQLSSPTAALFVFAKKMDGGLRLCVGSWALNRATVKNRYPRPMRRSTKNRYEKCSNGY